MPVFKPRARGYDGRQSPASHRILHLFAAPRTGKPRQPIAEGVVAVAVAVEGGSAVRRATACRVAGAVAVAREVTVAGERDGTVGKVRGEEVGEVVQEAGAEEEETAVVVIAEAAVGVATVDGGAVDEAEGGRDGVSRSYTPSCISSAYG